MDWQIVMAIMNFMVDYKAQKAIEGRTFSSEAEYLRALQLAFNSIVEKDEKDSPGLFPLQAFQSKGFQIQLNQTAFIALPSFGLERKSRFPNFAAVRTFLNERFNMSQDNVDEHNPLL